MPWLIRQFLDPDDQIVYVPADQVLTAATACGGRSFDARSADYQQHAAPDGSGEWCTFETLIDAYGLSDNPALMELARVVHAADVSGALDSHPLGPGLLARSSVDWTLKPMINVCSTRRCARTTGCSPTASSRCVYPVLVSESMTPRSQHLLTPQRYVLVLGTSGFGGPPG